MNLLDRAQRMSHASPLIALAIEESDGSAESVQAGVSSALQELSDRQLLHCFNVLTDDDPSSETFRQANTQNREQRLRWLQQWLETGEFWSDDVFDIAYGC